MARGGRGKGGGGGKGKSALAKTKGGLILGADTVGVMGGFPSPLNGFPSPAIPLGNPRAGAVVGGLADITIVETFGFVQNIVGAGSQVYNFAETLEEGDVVVVHAAWEDPGTDPGSEIVITSGYTSMFFDEAAIPSCNAMYKVMGATPDTSVQLRAKGNSFASWRTSVTYFVLRGVDPDTPLDAAVVGTIAGLDPPAITTVTDKAMVVVFAALDDDDNVAIATPSSGYTVIVDTDPDGDVMTAGASSMYKIVATAGEENPGTFTFTSGDQSKLAVAAFRPATA